MEYNLALVPGDGIGPEVVTEAVKVLQAVTQRNGHTIHITERLIGGCSIDRYGTALTDEALEVCRSADAVLLGAVGGPKWDDPNASVRPEQGLLRLRKELGVYANLRPVAVHPDLVGASPLKPEKLAGVDLIVVRELTGGLYFGQPKGRDMVDGQRRAVDSMVYTEEEIRRVVDKAFQLALGRRKKVTSVDKANVLESSRLWRQVAVEVSKNYPEVVLEHMLVDTASMRLITNPAGFDILVTENMFGDILTDEASVLAGSMGMLPSASLGEGRVGLYEPIHGSAPDIAGKGIANPIGTILSVALMLRYSFHLEKEAAAIESAVSQALSKGCRTVDLGGTLSTTEITAEILTGLGRFLG
ncbi:MAG TPA: 3-isopropylmalate dehydrogenase [Anaerolineaceae bacterium]|nr:3-isopropylmalate dehydrogenase [Anaerolineaceae bacterium]